MDEKSAVERVDAAYEKLTAANGRIKSLEKKLADGTLTMKEGAELTDLRAQAFGTAFSDKVLDIAQDERESACTELLRKRCDDTDEVAKAAQRGALSRQGLNLTPPTAPFEEDRARKIGHSLEDDTVPDETIQRRAKSATETMIRSQYDRDMKQGAKTCAAAGLKTYIIRDSASGCCKWCDEVAGKFAYGSEPKDVYRRHDNCSCSVVYESGRGRQNVWSKQYWSAEQEREYLRLRDEMKAKRLSEKPNVAAPVRLSEMDVRSILAKVKGLTFGRNDDKIIEKQLSNQDPQYNSVLNAKYSKGTKNAKAAYDKYIPDGGAVADYQSSRAYHGRTDHKVHLDMNSDLNNIRRAGTTWFHEHGHYVDHEVGYISENEDFLRAIRKDVKAYENKIKSSYRLKALSDARIVIGTELRSLGDISHSVQDIYGGTIGKPYPNVCYAHTQKYWKSHGRYGVCSEAFAHMFEASFDPDKSELMKQYLPNAWAEFEKMLGGVV